MPLHIYINGALEVPGDSVGLTLAAVGDVGHIDVRCDAGEQTAEVYTVAAPEGCLVSKDGVTYGATAAYPAGSIKDTDIPCHIKCVAPSSIPGAWMGGMTTPLPHLVATEAIPAAPAAPNAFTPSVTGITSSGATVTFATTDPNADALTYKVAVTASATPPSDWTAYADATSPKAVTGLTAATPYYVHVRASDGALTTVGTSAFSTIAEAVNTAPAAFTPAVTAITSSGATVAFSTTDPNADSVIYKLAVTTSATPPPVWTEYADVTSPQSVTGLTASTAYYAHVQARDTLGLVTVGSSAMFTTAAADITAPVIAGTLSAVPGPSIVTLSGPTATDSNGIGKWQRQTDGGAWVDVASTSTTFPTTVVQFLSVGGHTFAIRAVDPEGNPSETKTASTTVSVADTTGPTITGTLIAIPDVGKVTLSGLSASDPSNISAWKYQVDGGVWVTIPSSAMFTMPSTEVPGLTAGNHTFIVSTVDGWGNYTASGTKTVTATVF